MNNYLRQNRAIMIQHQTLRFTEYIIIYYLLEIECFYKKNSDRIDLYY